MIPVVCTFIDIFLQPSRRTLKVINEHVCSEYGIDYDLHLEASFYARSFGEETTTIRFLAQTSCGLVLSAYA
ncbi:hypothetical protein [Neisseria sicca]|uniref:hypothetical protein n=1 Tax=Neisseria sicca TaxID=490 RepID=UPI000496C7AC|nr:hypothetical protein [Neisseria sicca]